MKRNKLTLPLIIVGFLVMQSSFLAKAQDITNNQTINQSKKKTKNIITFEKMEC